MKADLVRITEHILFNSYTHEKMNTPSGNKNQITSLALAGYLPK